MKVYEALQFPTLPNRPFFYSDYVSTVDGVAVVKTKGYWPIGSRLDYEALIYIRAQADILLAGKGDASKSMMEMFTSEEFKAHRVQTGKGKMHYLVISGHPDAQILENWGTSTEVELYLATTLEAIVPKEFEQRAEIMRVGKNRVDILALSNELYKRGFKVVMVDGGPRTIGDFFQADLIDEVFLTIAPKIYGSNELTSNMVEGILLPPDEIKNLELISVKQVENELFLRYKVSR